MLAGTPDTHPLSFEQEASLSAAQPSAGVVRTAAVRLRHLDRPLLASALQALVGRHDVLRLRIDDAPEPHQRFLDAGSVCIRPRLFALPVDPSAEEDIVRGLAARLLSRPLDLAEEGPLRVAVAGGSEGPAYLAVAVHDVALDAQSFLAFVDELERLVTDDSASRSSLSAGSTAPSYTDYLETTVRRLRRHRVAINTAWWIDQAERIAFDLRLPVIDTAPSEPGPMYQIPLQIPATAVVDMAARHASVTRAALLLGAAVGGIASLARPGPLSISIPATPGRALVPPGAFGNFTMPLPLVVDATGVPLEDAQRAGGALTAGMLRWSYSFRAWREAFLSRAKDLASPPLSIVFVHRRVTADRRGKPSSRVEIPATLALRPNHLELWFEEGPEAFVAFARYSSAWFPAEVIEALCVEISSRVERLVP